MYKRGWIKFGQSHSLGKIRCWPRYDKVRTSLLHMTGQVHTRMLKSFCKKGAGYGQLYGKDLVSDNRVAVSIQQIASVLAISL